MSKTRKAKALEPTKENILARTLEIQERDGVGFVKAQIRARKEFGLVSPNLGKPRLSKKERAAQEATAETA